MTTKLPELSDSHAAVLEGIVNGFKGKVAEDLRRAGSDSERLNILARLADELASVRDRISGAARVKLGRFNFVLGLFVAGAAVGALSTFELMDREAGQNPGTSRQVPDPEIPSLSKPKDDPGSPEAAAARTAAEGGARAARTVDDLNASAKLAEIEQTISEFKSTYTMLKLTKTDELGDPLTEESTERLTKILADKKSYLLENGYSDDDIATLEEDARLVFKNSSSDDAKPPVGEEPPNVVPTSPDNHGFKI